MICPRCLSKCETTDIYCGKCQCKLKNEAKVQQYDPSFCPKCGEKMVWGFIVSSQMKWRMTKPGIFFNMGDRISDTSQKFWGASYLSGFRCFSCRIITIQY